VDHWTRVAGLFPNERAALTLIWASIGHDLLKWHGVRIDETLLAASAQASEDLAQEPISVPAAKAYLEAARSIVYAPPHLPGHRRARVSTRF